jgi:Glycosyl transferases group 1
LLRAFGSQFLRGGHSAPLVVLDQDDFPLINRSNLFLLERSQLYFKRELPIDRWRVFLRTAHANLPTGRFRRSPRWKRLVEKLRPISLGLPMTSQRNYPQASEKTADIFFAGQLEASSWIRKVGAQELASLSEAGVKVDLPSGDLSRDEFYSRCASSWLVWSPEGYGWECFRHYEALACASVPMINYPTIERHRPLIDGEHALFYPGEPGTLTSAVLSALADKPRLNRIAAAGRAHVMKHHTASSLAEHIVEQGLALGWTGL